MEWPAAEKPTKVEVKTIDTAELEAIRQKWQKQSLLLNKDKSLPREKVAPKDARYFSDRNTKVEREQRANKTAILPNMGAKQTAPAQERRSEAHKTPRNHLSLSRLGIPFRFDEAVPRPLEQRMRQRPNQETGDQAILDQSLPYGSENLLNTAESVYYSFYSRMYETIGPIWQSRIRSALGPKRVLPGDYSTIVDVVLDENGNLIEIIQKTSSSVREFDAAVEQAWREAKRFPNPPKGLVNPKNEVHTGWTFTVHMGDGFFQYAPPTRNY